MIAGAAAATVNMAILFAVGGVAIVFAVFLAPLSGKIMWNALASIAIAATLLGLWKITPKPKEPPTAQENAAAVVALEEQQHASEKQTTPTPSSQHSSIAPVSPEPKHSRPVKPTTTAPGPTVPPTQTTTVAHFTLTQSEDISSRSDAPHLARVVIQTNVEFPKQLKLALQCDGPITDGSGGISGVMMMVSQGVANGYPNVYVLTYESATPAFGPSSPITINLWSKQPIQCTQATTF